MTRIIATSVNPSLEGEIIPPLPVGHEKLPGYHLALIMGGATVHAYETFGSYQGDWWALVSFNNVTGWVHDYYGSCSGCDSFEAEFGWRDDELESYPLKLARFGRPYLENILSQEEAETEASGHISWDLDAQAMLDFIKREGRALEQKPDQRSEPA